MTDDELVERALRKAGQGSDAAVGRAMNSSEGSIRNWRKQLENGGGITLRGNVRQRLQLYLAGDNDRSSVEYWRGVVSMAQGLAQNLADRLALELIAEASPPPSAVAAQATSRAVAATKPPAAAAKAPRKSAGGSRK